jgi:type IV pilus biogenesis/stability protein PilW
MFRFKSLAICTTLFFCVTCVGCATDSVNTEKKVEALRDLGVTHYRQRNLRLALEKFQEAETLDPNNAEIHNELGLVYKGLEVYDLSLKHFKRALALNPDFSEAQNNLGTVYYLLKKWDQAIECFQKAVSNLMYKTPYYAYENMGQAYYNKGDYQQAIESYKKSITSAPDYPGPRLKLARLYLKLDRHDGAAEELKMIMEIDPDGRYGSEAKELMRSLESDS